MIDFSFYVYVQEILEKGILIVAKLSNIKQNSMYVDA